MNTETPVENSIDWSSFQARYEQGEWRAPVFCDMIRADLKRLAPERKLTVLDIGCGKGFDDDPKFQTVLAAECDAYLGVEPDKTVAPNPIIQTVHQCFFEEALIEPSSIDIAFAVMVLEHLENPQWFWDKVYEVLREGGVFWGFTMDSRHMLAKTSILMKNLKIKDIYLNFLHGVRGESRYDNYPVYYRSNNPTQIEQLTSRFHSRTVLNFHKIGQLDYYIPKSLRWIGWGFDKYIHGRGLPGSILAVRVVK